MNKRAPLILIGVWSVAVGAASLQNRVIQHTDTISFIKMADRLALRNLNSLLDGFCPVGFPFLLRAMKGLTGDYLLAGKAIVLLAGVLGMYLFYRMSLELFDRRIALLALLVMMVNPVYFKCARSVMTDIPALCFHLSSLLFLIKFLREGRPASIALSGLMLGFGYLMRYTSLLLVPGALFCLLLFPETKREAGFKAALIFLAMFVLGAMPQLVIASIVRGSPFWNLERLNVFYGMFGRQDYGISFRQARFTESLIDIILLDPMLFARNFVFNLLRTGSMDHAGIPTTLLGWIGLPVAVFLRPRRKGVAAWMIFAACIAAGTSIAFVEDRFLIFLGPLLCVSAAFIIVKSIDGVRRIRHRSIAVGILVCTILITNAAWFISPQFKKSNKEKAQESVSAALHAHGMVSARDTLSFSFEYYDLDSPLKERFMTPWFLPQAPPFDSLGYLVTFMRVNEFRFLVYDDSAARNVPGLSKFWPISEDEPRFDRIMEWRDPPVRVLQLRND